MKLIGLRPLLDEAQKARYAVGAYNFCNAETLQAVVEEGCARRSPLILIIGPLEVPLLGPRMVMNMVSFVVSGADVPVCLHLDHATDIESIKQCIEAGFPSVMMDGSHHDFETNVRLTKKVVKMAHARGITVEGELGAVGKVDDAATEGAAKGPASLTDPNRAAEFAERTGVDALAVAIGNAHGIYTKRPVLDFERLEAIRRATPVPLVLHGGSGTPLEQLQRVIEIGVSKVNVASEIGRAYLDAIVSAHAAKAGKVWYSLAIADAKSAVRQVVGRWIRNLGSGGKATRRAGKRR